MKYVSYWRDTAAAFAGGHTGPVEGHYDVAIIGGGFTGLGAALQLAKAGDQPEAINAAVEALAKGTEAFAAARMNRGIQAALTGRRLDAL